MTELGSHPHSDGIKPRDMMSNLKEKSENSGSSQKEEEDLPSRRIRERNDTSVWQGVEKVREWCPGSLKFSDPDGERQT